MEISKDCKKGKRKKTCRVQKGLGLKFSGNNHSQFYSDTYHTMAKQLQTCWLDAVDLFVNKLKLPCKIPIVFPEHGSRNYYKSRTKYDFSASHCHASATANVSPKSREHVNILTEPCYCVYLKLDRFSL